MTSILETQRLLLRPMTEADADHILALNRNPNVTRHIFGESPLVSREDALVVLRTRVFPQYALGFGLGRLGCIEKSRGDFLGWCGIKHMPDEEYDLGYRFFEQHWGHGYATEAARASCDFARTHLRGKRVVAKAMLENRGSRHVLEKVGLVYEGDVVEEGHALALYGLPT